MRLTTENYLPELPGVAQREGVMQGIFAVAQARQEARGEADPLKLDLKIARAARLEGVLLIAAGRLWMGEEFDSFRQVVERWHAELN